MPSSPKKMLKSALTGALLLASVFGAAGAAAAGDAAAGKGVFSSQCGMCHTANKGGAVLLGPNLFGVVGRKAGSVAGYNYSPAMKAAGFSWSADKLKEYLPSPAALVPGNKMPYGGLKNPGKVDDLVAYLDSLK